MTWTNCCAYISLRDPSYQIVSSEDDTEHMRDLLLRFAEEWSLLSWDLGLRADLVGWSKIMRELLCWWAKVVDEIIMGGGRSWSLDSSQPVPACAGVRKTTGWPAAGLGWVTAAFLWPDQLQLDNNQFFIDFIFKLCHLMMRIKQHLGSEEDDPFDWRSGWEADWETDCWQMREVGGGERMHWQCGLTWLTYRLTWACLPVRTNKTSRTVSCLSC